MEMGDGKAAKYAYLRLHGTNYEIRFGCPVATFTVKEIISKVPKDATLGDLRKAIVSTFSFLAEEKENSRLDIELPTKDDVLFLFTTFGTLYSDAAHLVEFIKSNTAKSLKVLNTEYSLICNAPLVVKLTLPSLVYAEFPIEPLVFKSSNVDRQASKFLWYKSMDQEKWVKIGERFQYEVQESDIGNYIKLVCLPFSQQKVRGPSVEAITENPVEKVGQLPQCPFEDRHIHTQTPTFTNKVRVVSYNVLANRYAENGNYDYCPAKYRNIHYRKQLIVKELTGYNADIICLQEVDDAVYKTYFRKEFNNMDFKSLYNRKGNCIPEGLLCAFRTSRFKLLDHKHLVFNDVVKRRQFDRIAAVLNINRDVEADFVRQSTSLQTVILLDKNNKKVIIVANTHLYYHPDATHIRLLQVFTAMTHLSNLRNWLVKEHQPHQVALIFCGDFNSVSTRSLYNFMITGTIDKQHDDCLKISPNGVTSISHKWHITNASGLPTYTNYTPDFKGCLDYVFVDKLQFVVDKVVPMPKDEDVEQYEALPNEFYPSDHLAVVVDLKYKKR